MYRLWKKRMVGRLESIFFAEGDFGVKMWYWNLTFPVGVLIET